MTAATSDSSRRSRNRRAGRGKRHRADTTAVPGGTIRQLAAAKLDNPFPPVCPLTEDHLEAVHETSMRVLEEQGIEVMSGTARTLFERAGATVNGPTVRLERDLVMALISTAPGNFTLTPRNPERTLAIGGRRINFGMVSGPPNVCDRINGRRPGNFEDFVKLVQLGQFFNVISLFGNQTLAPIDLPANTRHLDTYRATLINSDKVFSAIPIGAGRVRDAVELTARAIGTTPDVLAEKPALIGNININSPRKLDAEMAHGAMELAALGQAVIVTPFTLLGAMTPISIGAGLAQQNAEALFGIALTQLVRPGAPVVYGGFTSNVDMRSGAPAFGTPENARANLAGGQLARRYGLPYRTSACNASNAPDVQSAYETQMALTSAVLGYGNIIYHAAGWLEGGLVASFEKVIIDVEILQHMTRFLEPILPLETDLAAIAEVPPGGHFFGASQTLSGYRNAFYEPILSDWQNNESWQEAGGQDATQRATGLWQAALKTFQPPPLGESAREAMDDYVARRKMEIGDANP